MKLTTSAWIRRFFILLATAAVANQQVLSNDLAEDHMSAIFAAITQADSSGPKTSSPSPGPENPVLSSPLVTNIKSTATLGLNSERLNEICMPPGDGQIPSIPWVKRSDWIDIKTDVLPTARGDGTTDDTMAIQAALDLVGESPGSPKVVYLPPGTYRITRSLTLTKRNGGMFIGHGRDTRLVWDGRPGGRMFWSNGAARQSYIGLVWDGAGKAAVGIDHDSKTLYETRILHEYMEFRGFRVAGIRVGHDQKQASAEMFFSNLKFVNNTNGVLFQSWNDYNNVFEGCHFIDNGYGIRAEKGNVTVRDSRFEGSRNSDVFLSTHSHSIRRVVSSGSNTFIRTVRGPISNSLIKVEDSRVDRWHNPNGAIITELRGPVIIHDVTFTNPPGNAPPIHLDNPRYMNQIAILSNVLSPGTKFLVDEGPSGIVYHVPSSRRDGARISENQKFLHDKIFLAGNIIDVKQDCNAKGDGVTDDTLVVQACFDRAHAAKETVAVYFPSGTYKISQTLNVRPGAQYRIEGTGWHSQILWFGKSAGALLHVQDPDGLVIEHLALGGPKGTTSLLQTGTRPGIVRYHNLFGYHDDEMKDVHIVFDRLPRGTVVVADHLDGRIIVRNSSEATILLGFLVSVQMIVEGQASQGGFIGVLSRVSALESFPLIVRDNQSLTITDWYNEQTRHLVLLEGNSNGLGRVVIDHTQAETDGKVFTQVNGFHGLLAHTGGMFGRPGIDEERVISVMGAQDTDILLLGNMYWYRPPVEVSAHSSARLLGNSLNQKSWGPNAIVENVMDKQGNADIESVFDAFRQLGSYDLILNYCLTDAE